MVSVIACSKRPDFLVNLYRNFDQQQIPEKQLVLALHGLDGSVPDEIGNDPRCLVLHLPTEMPLGMCLNKAVKHSKFDVIAKFDDDDYYAPHYLFEAVAVLEKRQAEVVGKQSYLVYFKEEQLLAMLNPGKGDKQIRDDSDTLAGATLVFKKGVFEKVEFPRINIGEDLAFLDECRKQSIPIYASSPLHYIYIRYSNTHHTSDSGNNRLRKQCVPLLRTKNIAKYASVIWKGE
ncbi:hypothetical protein A8F94_17950 [Bacillus sp. FJAT-27225]|uniref:glycosyltransferase n=1 Tax=Bacillus sp. FJAT-27225 TaxID=1743144 RepID=UPI00080C302B|nr:glycosyltransferase [Bacillus sp. FJAT-27225]OCA83029.1 hypothetical protein A8F94_17950 [Bacillus sp. FJAT-27225]